MCSRSMALKERGREFMSHVGTHTPFQDIPQTHLYYRYVGLARTFTVYRLKRVHKKKHLVAKTHGLACQCISRMTHFSNLKQFTQHPPSCKPNVVPACSTCCYTPPKHCSDRGLQYTGCFQERLTAPHFPLSTQHVMTEYLNSLNNSDDTAYRCN